MYEGAPRGWSTCGPGRPVGRRQRPLGQALAAAVVLCLAVLPQRCVAETWDLQLNVFKDPVCTERVEDVVYMDEGCYANLYNNMTKAFKLKIIAFDYPQSVEINEYSDNCHTVKLGPRYIPTGSCTRLVSGVYAEVTLILRSKTCVGECSKLAVSAQEFFDQENCEGLPFVTYWYPTPGCIRSFNGTQELALSTDLSGSNITMTDYTYNNHCNGGIVKTYMVQSGACFALYDDRTPRSFKWTAYPATITGYSGPMVGGAGRGAEALGLPKLAFAAVSAAALSS